ncbi:PadR family transcriptional regulator [Stutzerimonas nitrititolerans]|uniref:PadR family transcriptional regulator n=1 Tax=Stutzerimonas nitrititolerans TaxID=2482751 RepID=A0ABX9UU05_9GAMM|nr:PadR family transcriptional regulator [Stutzerimonas nitrititolerans]RMH96419.1 PadR family transcriptional regulator [Stutzerimonas nitrititolerans]
MQYTITMNQAKALEWGLNAQQALLFAFVYECPSWAKPMTTPSGTFFALAKSKIIEELPLLTDKPDTAYRLLKQLEEAGVVELSHTPGITLVRMTDKGKEWNRKLDGSEKYPTRAARGRKNIRGTSEKNPIEVGKISEPGSEKYPTNQDTSNQDTNQETRISTAPQADAPVATAQVVPFEAVKPRVEIPADMPGPKDQSCKTFRTWANYAFAYRKRYSTWPVWNAKAGGQIGQLIDRLGADAAPQVAAFYLTVNDARLINDCHTLNGLLAKAEAFHTQWQTGRQINGTTARQIEQTQANVNAAQEAAQRIREKGGKRNAFL